MKKKKSQVTTELVIISSILFTIFLLTIIIIDDRNDHIIEFRKYMNAKDIADKTSYLINNVYISGFGSRDFIFIPTKLDANTKFNLTVIPKERIVVIDWDNQHYVSSLVTSNINGTLNILDGKLSAYNNMGEITLEQ